jgi:hypothetical protein
MIGKGSDGLPPTYDPHALSVHADRDTERRRQLRQRALARHLDARDRSAVMRAGRAACSNATMSASDGIWKISRQIFKPTIDSARTRRAGRASRASSRSSPIISSRRYRQVGGAWSVCKGASGRRPFRPSPRLPVASRRCATSSRSAICRTLMVIMSTSEDVGRRRRSVRAHGQRPDSPAWAAMRASEGNRRRNLERDGRRDQSALWRDVRPYPGGHDRRNRPARRESMRARAASRSAWSAATTGGAWWVMTRFDNLYREAGRQVAVRDDALRPSGSEERLRHRVGAKSWIAASRQPPSELQARRTRSARASRRSGSSSMPALARRWQRQRSLRPKWAVRRRGGYRCDRESRWRLWAVSRRQSLGGAGQPLRRAGRARFIRRRVHPHARAHRLLLAQALRRVQ